MFTGKYADVLVPLYDNEESVCGIIYNGTPYYFQKNQQGDVVAIFDANCDVVARYAYDAWGKVTTITGTNLEIAYINPYRYRGYYFDREIEMYYLQSRYYDPEVGRFVCGDLPLLSVVTTNVLEHNLFSYCENAPIMNTDPAGYEIITITVLGKVVLTAMIVLTLMYMLMVIVNSPEFQRSFSSFCTAVGNSFSSVWQTVTRTAERVSSWKKQQIRNFAKILSDAITVARATSRVISAIKTIRSTYANFYEIHYYGNLPIIGKRINRNQAMQRAKQGGNSITYYRANALWVANVAGNARAMHHTPHGGNGYFSHYHIYRHANSAHIAYLTV